MKKIFTCLAIFFLVLSAAAQQSEQKFVQELRYLLYLPDGYANDTARKWPLVLFLHGSGESGTDLEKVKAHGPPKLVGQGKKFPFILISPQATEGWKADQLIGLIRDIKKKYRVEDEQVYATGLSMGGFGSWALSMDYPREFAAIAPICGGGDVSKIWKLRNLSVWNFHGAKDNVVPLDRSTVLMDELKKYNPSAKFTIYPEANHDSWTETYNNEEFYTWLLSQRRFRYKQVAVKPAILKEYEGSYLISPTDTITISVKGEVLQADLPRKRVIDLKPAADNIFFIENDDEDFRFTRNAKGVIDGVEVWGDVKVKFNKVQATKNTAVKK
jgi:predicted esterase